MFKRITTVFLAFVLLITFNTQSVLALRTVVDDNINKSEFVKKYSGIDLLSTDFKRENMNKLELEAYESFLELMYKENRTFAERDGYTRDEYILLVDEVLSGRFKVENDIVSRNGISYYSTSHGLISTQFLGGVFNGLITAGLLLIGVGSVRELVTKLGRQSAMDWVERNLKQVILDKLISMGLGAAVPIVGSIVKGIVDAYFDPGAMLANAIDRRDLIPNNGYIELW